MTATESLTTSKPSTVLLVDDDPDCRMLLREAIADVDPTIDVREAGGGDEARADLRNRDDSPQTPRPGLIFLDVQMTDRSGQEVLKAIKSDPELNTIAVVMLTGVDDAEQIRLAAANGANSYAVKPTDPDAFLRSVQAATRYWLGVHRLADDGTSPNATIST